MGVHLARSEVMTDVGAKVLTGKHALLVEDQTLIALDTEMLLRELGAAVVDTFTTAETAIEWLASARPDVGILDISLGATASSFPVAEVLERRATPFIFTTGYDDQAGVPQAYADAQIVRKPYTREALSAALAVAFGVSPANP